MFVRYSIPFTLVIGFVVVPLLTYLLCRYLLPKRIARKVALVAVCIEMALFGYGLTFGFEELEVKHMEYASADLPKAFDGYRIVQFSDIHVGSFEGRRAWVVQQAVDSIMALQPDMIVFTGDLQNLRPTELTTFRQMLKRLRAKDGVYSVLGNHDYDLYLPDTDEEKQTNNRTTQQFERSLGWTLLMNEHRVLRRGSDSLVIAGMENWGDVERMPRRGDVGKTLQGIKDSAFVVMLQHDPSAWRAKILPECKAQLTLSGHTHGMQFGFWGWSPMALMKDEWGGTLYEGTRALHVSTGIGGLVPFRLGMPGEIVEITLRSK